MRGKLIKSYSTPFFCNRLQGGRFQVTMLLSWLVCIVVVLRGIKMAWEEKSIFKQQKKIFYIFWFIYLWSRRKKSFAQQAERWAAYVLDFSSKWETPIICHQERLRKNPLKIRIYSSFFSRKKEEIIIIILEKKDFMTHINKLFSNLSKHTI